MGHEYTTYDSVQAVADALQGVLGQSPGYRAMILKAKMRHVHTAMQMEADRLGVSIDARYLQEAQDYARCLEAELMSDKPLPDPQQLTLQQAVALINAFLKAYAIQPTTDQVFRVADIMFAIEADTDKSVEIIDALRASGLATQAAPASTDFCYTEAFIRQM